MPDAIFFDLDGTLSDRNTAVRHWLAGHLRKFDLPEAYGPRFLELDDFGYLSKRVVMPQLVAELGLSHDPAELLADFSAHAFAAPVPLPHAYAVLDELRSRGVKLGIVTNGWVEAQRQTLSGLDLPRRVDDVVISEAVGLSKPDPRIYRLALERLGVEASRCWFVGDSPRNDVWGPQQVGLRAAFLQTGHALGDERPEVTLRDLRGALTLP